MRAEVIFAGLPVAEIVAAADWYERLLGAPPDMRPHEGERAWRLSEGGWLYVVEDAEAAGGGRAALIVGDLEGKLQQLAEAGIEAGELDTVGGGMLRCVVEDPDGNRITLGQAPAG